MSEDWDTLRVGAIIPLCYLSVSTRAAIGHFCGPYSTVRLAEFESSPSWLF